MTFHDDMCVAIMITTTVIVILQNLKQDHRGIPRQPNHLRDLWRNNYMYRILHMGSESCISYLRMDKGAFFHLAEIMRERGLLRDTKNCIVEEQLAMFLNIVGHKTKNRVVKIDFIRSGETVSRYFNKVLGAICAIRDLVMQQPSGAVHPVIESSEAWFPFFKDCIGLIDGTHIDCMVPLSEQPRFYGRKGLTQNVLAAATPDKLFTYILAGWEGSANDLTVLRDALSQPPPQGLKVIEGKYYLCDAGYTTMSGFIALFRSVRYHLKEQVGHQPRNRKELFNLRHSSLRTKIESTFGILKNRFRILSQHKPFHPFPTQVDTVLACCVLHNYIAKNDPNDPILNCNPSIVEDVSDAYNSQLDNVIDLSLIQSQRKQRDDRNIWLQKREQIARDMWWDYCQRERESNFTEEGL